MANSSHLLARVHLRIAVLAALAAWPSLIYGGMSYPPSSYVMPSDDGKHILVMLSPTPVDEDEGNVAKLPDGRTVSLKSTYPKSGYYKVESTVPIWTVDDFSYRQSTHVSSDGRNMVIVSDNTSYYAIGPPGKQQVIYERDLFQGVKFYDNGNKITEYTQYDLVDFSRLIPFDGWADESNWDELDGEPCARLRVDGNRFELRTTTRDRFVFDITTGKILEEHHFWRWLHRVGMVIVALLGIGAFCVFESILRFRRHVKPRPASQIKEPQRREETLRISLRGLLVYMTMFCLALGLSSYSMTAGVVLAASILLVIGFKKSSGLISKAWGIVIFFFVIPVFIALSILLPHVAILVASLTVSVLLARWLLKFRAGRPHTALSLAAITALGLSTVFSWLAFCILTMAPAHALLDSLRAEHDVRVVVAHTVYAPIVWYDKGMFYRSSYSWYEWYRKEWGAY